MTDHAAASAKVLAILSDPANIPAVTKHLGLELTRVDTETNDMEAEFTVRPEFRNPNGSCQGGIVSAFLDEIMSLSLFVAGRMKSGVPTLEMKTTYLRPLMTDRARCVGRTVRQGRSVGFTEGQLFDENGKLCATATATAAIRPFKVSPEDGQEKGHGE